MGRFATTTSLQIITIGTTYDTATTALVDKCITQGESKILGALAVRYDTGSWTSGSVPPLVITLSENLGAAYFYRANGRGGKESFERYKVFRDEVEETLKALVEDRTQSLYDSTGSLLPDLSTGAYMVKSTTMDYNPIFDLDTATAWEINSDQLTEIDTDRA